ncbi:GumC family protein [Planctomycetes bacterium K23_9]|uniref:Chain length determinant protein n=1 Tax=Stieleria marina TaxID=1930275 RepID=A0A517NZN8_9BACT|nr:Chain length determinant protein [Planctomycetes bacterium K23_9]
MSSSDHTPLTLTEIIAGGWRQKWFAIPLFLVLAVACIAVLWLMPNRYTSEAQLLVRLGPNAVSMDPTTELSRTVSLQESRLHQVNSVMELINSREMIQRVAKRIGTDRILQPIGFLEKTQHWLTNLAPNRSIQAEGGYSAAEVAELIELGKACKKLERDLVADVGKKAYTIDVRYVSNSPYLAHDIVEAMLEEYPRYHANAHGSTGSLDFFKQELKSTLDSATDAQGELRDLKLKMGIVDLDSEKLALQEKLSQLERATNDTDSKLAEVDAEMSSLKTEIASLPERIVAEETTGIFKRSGDLVRQGLYELELKEKELSTNFNPDHPKMLSIREQLQQARLIANSEIGQSPQVRNVANPLRQQLDLLHRQAIAKRAGLQAKQKQLALQLASARAELVDLNVLGADLTRLNWDAEVAENTYLDTAKRLANARQIADLESFELSDVTIAQPATLQLTKTGPLRFYIGLVGFCIVGCLTFFAAALRDKNLVSSPTPIKKRRPIEVWTGPAPTAQTDHASIASAGRQIADQTSLHPELAKPSS